MSMLEKVVAQVLRYQNEGIEPSHPEAIRLVEAQNAALKRAHHVREHLVKHLSGSRLVQSQLDESMPHLAGQAGAHKAYAEAVTASIQEVADELGVELVSEEIDLFFRISLVKWVFGLTEERWEDVLEKAQKVFSKTVERKLGWTDKEAAAQEAADAAIALLKDRTEGHGGLVVLDRHGNVGAAHNTGYLAHAYVVEGQTNRGIQV